MTLEPQQKPLDRAIEHLKLKWGERDCPYCGKCYWQVGDPVEIEVGRRYALNALHPVQCGECGQTTFVRVT